MSTFLHGLLLGFSIAAPVGPIGLLCLRRALTDGRHAGLVSGLGAATADALYGCLAALGLTAVAQLLVAYERALQVGGGLFLLYLGFATLRSRPPAADSGSAPVTTSLGAAYGSTLVLTLANPLTIVAFVGLFAGTGAVQTPAGPNGPFLLVAGVFFGSAAWWLCLSSAAAALGSRLSSGGLRVINRLSGLFLLGFGLRQLLRLV